MSSKKIYNLFKHNFYSSFLPPKRGEEINKIIMSNYPDIYKRNLNKSLISQKGEYYTNMRKAIRFWGCFADYAVPKIKISQFFLSQKALKNSRQVVSTARKDYESSISSTLGSDAPFINRVNRIKLPQLYTNSNSRMRSLSTNDDFTDIDQKQIQKARSAIDLIRKKRYKEFSKNI